MEILRITDHTYSIVYVNDNTKYNVYRRHSEDKWDVLSREEWKNVVDTTELEELYNKRINGNGYE